MITNRPSRDDNEAAPTAPNRFGFYSALCTALLTTVTFGFALYAIPISGANCLENCVEYPYLDTAARFPRDFMPDNTLPGHRRALSQDFMWMPLAILLVLAYVTLMVSIHAYAPDSKKTFSQAGLSFALMAATMLASVYFIQFSVIPISLMKGETDGLAALIQYNPHGVFIAMEELGYLLMSLSFLFMAPVFAGRSRLERAVRWIFAGAFFLAIAALLAISLIYGLERLDRFEVAVISIDWLVLIVNGILLSILFKRQQHAEA
jgi:hypothetical protein